MYNEKICGIIFSNTHERIITELTEKRTLGSVPFGGRYRFIDFALSNMVRSGIDDIGVITKYNYLSLIDHLGSGREWDLSRKVGGLHILPPFGNNTKDGIYRGKLDALNSAVEFLRHTKAQYVVLSDCNIICNMDLTDVIDYHISKGADLTMVYKPKHIGAEEFTHGTVIDVDRDGKVTEVRISSTPKETDGNYSMEIFVMSVELLLALIEDADSKGKTSFSRDVIQARINSMNVYGYKYDGFVENIYSMKSYFQANMDLLNESARDVLFPEDSPVYTKIRDEVPAKYGLDSRVKNSSIADGCIIEGTVENCILYRGVVVKEGAIVRNSVIMQGTVIGKKAEVNYAIADKNVYVDDYRIVSGTMDYPVYLAKDARV